MADLLHPDFQDFLRALTDCEVRYVLVGGYSVILHGYARTTGDLDVWVERTAENYARLEKAFHRFGMPVFDMTPENFLHNPAIDVFTFGRQPVAIDLLTQVHGVTFEAAFRNAVLTEVDGLVIRLLSRPDLLAAKRAAGRPRDLNDLEHLGEEA
ncbi:MAG: nucleotidyltransferase [Hymenobacteraceae bacterium]|nr:nucleotidyltransferase [Hymenobacteraceae bacterium]